MADDLVEQLRKREKEATRFHQTVYARELSETIARITALEAEVERLAKDRDAYMNDLHKELDRAEKAEAALAAKDAEIERLKAAMTPSAETKAALMGEFTVPLPEIDEDGEEYIRRINVPWTTVKEIMTAIRARAALQEGE